MDYLAFGLLTGSLIVITSFVVRDALPHLAAIADGSRLARLSRSASPLAWARWCADAGLVLAAAGTLVLVITVAALLADLSDDAGNIVVGLSVAAAIVASAIGAARLGKRLRGDTERELRGEPWPVAAAPARTAERPVISTEPALIKAAQLDHSPRAVELASAESGDVWEDDLPLWSPPTRTRQESTGATVPEVALDRDELVASVEEPGAWGYSAPPAAEAPPRAPMTAGGLFSSPLLADIGLPTVDDEEDDGFRSPLLSDLRVGSVDDGDGDVVEEEAGSDLLIDETPAPIQVGGRLRDEVDDR